jgi:MFS family permease
MPTTSRIKVDLLLWRVFLPFVLGLFSFLPAVQRQAVVAPQLAQEVRLDPGQLGSLTAVYFLGFAVVQIPLGACLDRFGPVRIQVPLCLLAAVGATTFSYAHSPWQLVAGRLLVGVGVAGASLQASRPSPCGSRKIGCPNRTFVAFGTLGAVAATAPTEWLLTLVDWRGLFQIFACALVLIALSLSLLVPASPRKAKFEENHGALLTYAALFVSSPDRHRIHHYSLAAGGGWPLSSERVQRGAPIVGPGAGGCAELVLDNHAHTRTRRGRPKTDSGIQPIDDPELSERHPEEEHAYAASL